MKNQNLSIKIGNFLYNRCYKVYKILYPILKNRTDAFELSLMKNHIQQGYTVLDIGANIGFTAKHLSRYVGASGKVYAFEPDTVNYAHLLENIGHTYSNIKPVQAAVGEKNETIHVYKSPMLNVDHRTYPIENFTSKEEVKCLSIDGFLKPEEQAHFIKMDIQGYEYFALQGMKQTLLNNRNHLAMIMEFWPWGLQKAGASAQLVFDFIQSCGYQMELIDGKILSLLDSEKVKQMQALPEEYYFNVWIKKQS